MPPPVGTILHAGNRPGDHWNHIHVEPPTRIRGIPPLRNPGMTAGIRVIYQALEEHFGPGAYFDSPQAKDAAWTHMGGWNRRPIAGSTAWSQHAYWNAIDIGPYYGLAQQQRFLDFLTGKTGDTMDHQHTPMPSALPRDWADGSWERWVARSKTDPKSRAWTFYREDLSWVYDRVIHPLEARCSTLESKVKTLESKIAALEARPPGDGGTVYGTVVKLARP